MRAAARRDHDRHRRRQAERARAGDDEDGDRVDAARRPSAARGPTEPQARKVSDRDRDHARHELAGDASAMRCIGARERCACATICTICASTVCEPIFSARITRLPLLLMVAPMSAIAGALFHRHRLAGEHRLVDGASVPRQRRRRPAPSRPGERAAGRRHARASSAMSSSRAVGLEAARGLGRQAEQGADRGRCLRARAQLEQLAQQRERNDHRRGLEVDGDAPRGLRRRRGTCPARGWRSTL